MRYRRLLYKFDNSIHIIEYTKRGHCHAPRGARQNPTSTSMKAANHQRKIMKALNRILKYFKKTDWFVTLTYCPSNIPANMDEAKEDFRKFRIAITKEYKKRGYVLRWIRNIELTKSGTWHIHMIITRIPGGREIIESAWTNGFVNFETIEAMSNDLTVAKYISKDPYSDEDLLESSHAPSRNMPIDEPKNEDFSHWIENDNIKVPAGYYLAKDTQQDIRNFYTGNFYRSYVLYRINHPFQNHASDYGNIPRYNP